MIPCWGGHTVHWRMFSSISGLYPQEAVADSTPVHSCDNQKCLQTLLYIRKGSKSPLSYSYSTELLDIPRTHIPTSILCKRFLLDLVVYILGLLISRAILQSVSSSASFIVREEILPCLGYWSIFSFLCFFVLKMFTTSKHFLNLKSP